MLPAWLSSSRESNGPRPCREALGYELREGGVGGHWTERVDWDLYPDDPDFVVLADTEGNRFCVVDTSHG